MYVCVSTFSNVFSETTGPIEAKFHAEPPWNLVCSIGCSSTTKLVQLMTLGWFGPILWHGQIGSLMFLYVKKVKQ